MIQYFPLSATNSVRFPTFKGREIDRKKKIEFRRVPTQSHAQQNGGRVRRLQPALPRSRGR